MLRISKHNDRVGFEVLGVKVLIQNNLSPPLKFSISLTYCGTSYSDRLPIIIFKMLLSKAAERLVRVSQFATFVQFNTVSAFVRFDWLTSKCDESLSSLSKCIGWAWTTVLHGLGNCMCCTVETTLADARQKSISNG